MIKSWLKYLFWTAILFLDQFAFYFYRPNQKATIIVIRTDAIGDYILFRNFLQSIYEHYGVITLVGNDIYQDMAMQIDAKYIQEFIPINRKKFTRNLLYRLKTIKILRKKSYDTLINPIYSRDRLSEDIVRSVLAREKIASTGDNTNLSQYLKNKYDKNYTTLLPTKKTTMFEFYRNLEFFSNLFSSNIQVEFQISLTYQKNDLEDILISSPYSILFIGASEIFRKWNKEYFIEIGKFLFNQYQDTIIICGGKDDYDNGEYIKSVLNEDFIKTFNLCGQTTLMELIEVIHKANFVITNETSSAHIAMAVNHPKTFVISNGNHLYRFTPYPKEMNVAYHVIFHPLITKNINSYSNIANLIEPYSKLDINEISPQSVIEAIQKLKI